MNPYRRLKRAVGVTYYTVISIPGAWREDPQAAHYALPWFSSLLPGRSPLHDAVPWLSFRAVEWLEGHLRPDMRIFEYGSGGSTLFFAQRVREVASVEHDRAWHEAVAAELAQRGVANCVYRLVEPEPAEGVGTDTGSYLSRHPYYQGLTFARYVQSILAYEDASFDLVLIDGRARIACADTALAKVKPGGYLILDNMERDEYQIARSLLAALPCIDISGILPYGRPHWSVTTVWRKSAAQSLP